MHGRGMLVAAVLGFTLFVAAPSSSQAAFDVDGNRQSSMSTTAARLTLRETFTHNLIRMAGYGDQCTAYALDRMHEATGVWMAVRGNARDWASEASEAGWRVGPTPMPGSVMVMPPASGYLYRIREMSGLEYETPMHPFGHVAWVESVEGDWVLIKDQNWRRGELGERWVHVKESPMRFIYAR